MRYVILTTMQPVLSGRPREVAKVAAKARWLLKSGALGKDDSLGLAAMVFESFCMNIDI